MHILIVHGYLLDASGSCTYVRNLAKGFVSQRHRVTVACQDNEYKSDKFETFLPIPHGRDILLPVYVYNKYDGYNAKCITEMTNEEVEDHIELVSNSLANFIKENNVDFIFTNHCLFSPVNVKRALDKCKLDIPYVSKVHGSALHFVISKDMKRWEPYVKEGMKSAKTVICGSEYMENRFIELFGVKYPLIVIPCGVDTTLFSSGERSNKTNNRCIYFGNILDTKGIAELIVAYPYIKGFYPDFKLYIAGTGTYYPNMIGMLNAMENDNRDDFIKWAREGNFLDPSVDADVWFKKCDVSDIELLGFINHNELKVKLAESDIMVAPSKAPEAFGLVTIESMAAGVYPIVSDHSGLKNVVDIVKSNDSKISNCMKIKITEGKIQIFDLVRAVVTALDYVNDESPSEKLKELSLGFDWSVICKRILHGI